MKKEDVLKLATEENPVINCAGNKIEFKNGDVYAKDFSTGLYRKVKCFVL